METIKGEAVWKRVRENRGVVRHVRLSGLLELHIVPCWSGRDVGLRPLASVRYGQCGCGARFACYVGRTEACRWWAVCSLYNVSVGKAEIKVEIHVGYESWR